MKTKIVKAADTKGAYKRIADEKADGGDLLGALGFYMTAFAADPKNPETIADVADCYADMGLLELSNKYWFKYLTVAPKDKQSVAYEELAINFFYLDNLWASGYYFHLKVERDGFIAEEGLDEEIIQFFSSSEIKKSAYYLAYPFDKADYSGIVKTAKRALSAGDLKVAIKNYRKIPADCRTEEISGDYAVALFLSKCDDEVKEVCKDSLARHGENVTAYCNLSSLYHARGDDEKAEYYYRRALTVRKGEKAEDYKIAACAIERGDDELVKRCVLTILEERPYDDVMNFFYGVSLINTGDFAGGATAINVSLKISPEDPVYEYYSDFARKLTDAKAEERKALPLKYVKALPSDAESRYKKTVNAFVNGKKSYESLSDDGVKKILKAELFSEDIKIAKSAAFLLGVSGTEKDRKILELALLDGDVDDEIKSSVVYLLVNSGDKRKINAVISNYFATVRPRKVVFENKKDGALFMSAYALAVAKSMFWGVEDTAKIAFNMNALYTHFKELIRFNGFGVDAIAACCYLMCEFPRLNDVNNVCVAFGVSRADESQVEEFYEFVKKSLPEKMRERAESARNTRIKENEGDKDNQS